MYMSLVEGGTLKAWICGMPATADLAAVLGAVGRALGALHDADVVHGDLTSEPSSQPPPSGTKWTRLVHPSVLIGHVL